MTDVNNDSKSDSSGSEGQDSSTGTGQDFVPPKDGSWMPRERANEMVQNAVASATAASGREVSELRGRLDALTEAQTRASAEPAFSDAQLRAQVDAGQMTEAEASDIRLKSSLDAMEKRIVSNVTANNEDANRQRIVTDQVEAYKAKIPAMMAPESAERARVVAEYNFLVNTLGHPATNATELAAMRAVFGPVEALGVKADGTPEHHQETSGSGGGDESQGGKQPVDGAPAHLSPDEKRYYRDLIQKKIYPDWKAVEAELKYADKHLRKRMGARV